MKEHTRPLDAVLDVTTFIGWQVLPLIWIFTSWLSFADYPLPLWLGWVGVAVFALALVVLWSAYRALGANWSPKIDIRRGQKLVAEGIFKLIRHPIYAGIWLWAASQPLLVQNWIGGWLFFVSFAALYLIRVPREERMLVERFGDEYREYAERTPRILPRLASKRG